MNIANPCKLFLIVSTLAAGFSLRADGTLPIPVAETELPFLMNGAALESTTTSVGSSSTTLDISMTLDVANPTAEINPKLKERCRKTESFYPAAGSVQVAEELFDVQGICAPGLATAGKRQIIATSTGRVLQFDGSFAVSAAKQKSFKGELLKIDSVATTPETGASGTKVITFELHQLPNN
ncbi:MAG: hypothetical protein EOP07_02005 [Proteobacteria bacterium]|nr:MAG: hypothetical protein EOP07_02005 [Pseudomonadota bacterium]